MTEDMEKKLADLQGPFNWKMPEFDHHESKWDSDQDEAFLPQMTFVRFLMSAYCKIMKLNFDDAEKELKKAEAMIIQLNGSKKEVAKHILESTKVHLFLKKEDLDEAREILENIKNINEEKYLSDLYEMKASLWTRSFSFDVDIAIELAELAIEYNSNNATAHFLLSTNLRKKRRLATNFSTSTDEEIYHLEKAFQLEKNPQFGLFLGQAFKEQYKMDNALIIYNELFSMNIQNAPIQRRLALFFLRENLEKCKECLDYAEQTEPDNSMFLHYKGLYLMKIHKYQEAAEYLKKTENQINFAANLAYVQCMHQIMGNGFDFVGYFLNMLKKYQGQSNYRQTEMLLYVAFSYFNINRDIEKSVEYFYKAFVIEESGYNMKKYRDFQTRNVINVYSFLLRNVFPVVKRYTQDLPQDVLNANEKLQEICKKYFRF